MSKTLIYKNINMLNERGQNSLNEGFKSWNNMNLNINENHQLSQDLVIRIVELFAIDLFLKRDLNKRIKLKY